MGYISLDTHLLTCKLIRMLIGLVIVHINAPPLVIVFFFVTRWFLGIVKSKELCLALILKQNIELLQTLLLNYFGCVGYFKIWDFHIYLLHYFIVIIVVPCRLLIMMCFMSVLSTLRMIVISYVITSFKALFASFLFPLPIKLQIYSLRLTRLAIFMI